MSKEKVKEVKSVVAEPTTVVNVPPPNPKMLEEDRLSLELAKSRRDTVLAQAKEATAKAETADLAYRYTILQVYMKYGLGADDAINENGDIIIGGAKVTQAQ